MGCEHLDHCEVGMTAETLRKWIRRSAFDSWLGALNRGAVDAGVRTQGSSEGGGQEDRGV